MNQVKQLITLLLIIVITSYTMSASSIKGYVFDKHTKEPIIGAIVSIPNQNLAVQTDIDGCFKIDNVKIGIEQIVIRSIGYKEYSKKMTINENSNLDLGRIHLKRTHDKRYHRLMLSWNPSRTPNIASYSHNNLSSFVNYELAYGVSASYLYGFHFYDNWALEFGAKYNYSWHKKTELAYGQGYAEAKHHYISAFTNLSYNIPISNIKLAPYFGIYWRKFLESKSTVTLLNGESVTYNVDDCFQSPWLNFGFHSGIGIKYNQFYLGSEFGLDFIPECNYKVGANFDNDDIIKFEYSISIGYEF